MDRRQFLKLTGAVAAASLGVPAVREVQAADSPWPPAPPEWRNWSGSQSARPAAWLAPRSEEELVRLLKDAVTPLRVRGASHSFSPLLNTQGSLLSLDGMKGVIASDSRRRVATVWAGTRISELGDPLWERGQGLINQGDVDPQSVAGAIGTSTHGTGITLGSFSSTVRGLRLITAEGDAIECSPTRERDVFHATCTSVGALGVVTQATLQNRAAYSLHEREFVAPLREVLDNVDKSRAENRHFEFWAFYESDHALVKILNETDREPTPTGRFNLPVDALLWSACEIAHGLPSSDGFVQRVLTRFFPESERVGRSYQIFPSPRKVRFNEMEYELPMRYGPECVEEIVATVKAANVNTLIPLEYRYVAADDCWLSPFYQRDSVSISIHQYHSQDYRELFGLVEPIFWKYEGRPHWGKLHTLKAEKLVELYPRWQDFQKVRRRLDPRGVFLNAHLRELFE